MYRHIASFTQTSALHAIVLVAAVLATVFAVVMIALIVLDRSTRVADKVAWVAVVILLPLAGSLAALIRVLVMRRRRSKLLSS